jgi:hypothetical protein
MLNSFRHAATRSLHRVTTAKSTVEPIRVARRNMGGGHTPVPQSANAPMWGGHDPKVISEGWETSLYFYYGLAVVLQLAIVNFAPETSIESWARPEAQARLALKEQGFTDFQFGTHYRDVMNDQRSAAWEKYAERAIIPGDDDDDDDDEEDEENDEEEDDE